MFKKILSVILSLIMVLSCMTALAVPGVAAGSTTSTSQPITALSQITDMEGDYYLSADIGSEGTPNTTTVSSSFKGTLDGNGRTIYTSVPVFAELGAGAEISNLTTAGALTVTGGNCGAVAAKASGAFIMTNCTNNADITYTMASDGVNVGGFVGYVTAGGVKMTGCTNNGDLVISAKNTSGQARVGGLIGRSTASATNPVSKAVYTHCINYGAITDNSSFSLIGGLVGYYSNDEYYEFNTCKNFGTITGGEKGGKVGGLIGVSDKNKTHDYINCHNNAIISSATGIVGGLVGQDAGVCTFNDCTNKGEVKRTEYASPGTAMGGIIGYASADTKHTYIDCVNEAPVTGPYVVGGIVGQDNGTLTMKGCRNKGKITGPEGSKVLAYMGGLVGQQNGNYALFIENSANEGNIEITTTNGTKLVGGIIGRSENAANRTFINCTNSGDICVNTGGKIGGMAGCIGNKSTGVTTVIGCVNSGDIYAYGYAGGMVGHERGPVKFISCINNGTMMISSTSTDANSYAAGMGALVDGTVTAYSCFNNGTVVNNYKTANVADLAKTVATKEYCDSNGTTTVAVEFEGIQRSIAVENETTFSMRFITSVTDINQYSSTGVLVYVATSGESSVGFKDVKTNTVYTQISGSDDGVSFVYPETPIDGTYFTALTVTDISVKGTYSFITVPYTVALDGETITYGEAYTTVVADGEIATCYNLAESAGMSWMEQTPVTINGNSLSDYTIIYETERDGYEDIAIKLSNNLQAIGYNVSIAGDDTVSEKSGAKEILIGKTNRVVSQTHYSTVPNLLTYSVVISDSYVQVLCGGPYSASVCVDAMCIKFIETYNKAFQNGEIMRADLNLNNNTLTDGADLRVMTSNILAARWATDSYYPNCPPVAQRAEIYAATLISSKPDVIGVQESDNDWITILPYYLTFIKENYGIEYEWIFEDWKSSVQTNANVSKGQTMTTLIYRSDKYKLEDSGIENVGWWTNKQYNIRLFEWVLLSEKENPEHRFIVCNTHWGISSYTEEQQLASVQLSIDGIKKLQTNYPNVPIFHTGDFNLNNTADSYYTEFLTEISGFDAMLRANEDGVRVNDCGGCGSIGGTRGANGNYIDHIACVGSNIDVLKFETLVGKNIYCTDHLPQIVDVGLW